MPKEQKKSQPRYRIAPGPDTDLEREDVRDIRDKRITEASVTAAVEHGHEHFERVGRPVGRPSMSAPGKKSPVLGVRLPEKLKLRVEARAKQDGIRPGKLVRAAIEEYMKR